MSITVSEDLNASKRSPMRFVATLDGDTDFERGGFGANEVAALSDLIDQFPKSERASLAGATIERVGIR